MKQISTLKLARWAGAEGAPEAAACFLCEPEELPESLAGMQVLMGAEGDEAHVAELLALGAARVLLRELALRDAAAVQRLVAEHGGERIGVWVEAERTNISWALAEEAPNAGFKCMYPTRAIARWEVLNRDQSYFDADAEIWLGQMLELGVSAALVCMDMVDQDMHICAGLNIEHEGKVWFAPLREPGIDVEPWVRWGKVRQILLPEPNPRDEAEMARIAEPALVTVADEPEAPVAEAEADVPDEAAAGQEAQQAEQA